MKNVLTLSLIAAASIQAAEPMVPESMSTDRGGTKSAIDAYSDGGGVYLYDNKGRAAYDNFPMNNLVFKYGAAAKDSSASLRDQVKTLSQSTAEEKLLADKIPASSASINPPDDGTICNDFDPKTIDDIFTAGACRGTNVEGQSCDDENVQTIEDKYVSGVCVGNNVEGQSCDDKNVQTIDDKYVSGVCVGTNVEGQACDDKNVQTINDKYISGICIGTNVEGQTCNDNNVKTVGDKYVSGVCTGTLALACKEIKLATNTNTNGLYTVYPDGVNGMSVYCDMTTDGGGWTVIANSFANAAGNTSKPFDVTYATAVNSGVGSPGITANYFMPISKYYLMANSSRPVQYVWYAKSGKSADPFVKTIEYSSHYLGDSSTYYTWNGSAVYAFTNLPAYNGAKLTTNDADRDTSGSNCAVSYGSFGWYTACHSAHYWSTTSEQYSRGGAAVANGYSNYGPDAAGSYNTWYQLKIMIR